MAWWWALLDDGDGLVGTAWWWGRLDDENGLVMRTAWWWRRLDDEDDLMMRTIYLSTLNWADKEFFLTFLYIASLGQAWQNPSNINPRIGLRALISSTRSDINPRVGFELLSETQPYGQANDKKFDNEKTTEDDISNVKFANMTSRRSSKYASMFINKTSNNLLWRSVIYDSDCNDSLIYDLNRFVNEVTFVHEMIGTSNDFMLIEEYEIMLVIDRINEKNRRMFFDNIAYVLFIDVMLMFVTRLKKQDFVWDMYKKALMIKSIDVMICDIEKKHDLSLLKYRLVKKFVNAIQSHKKILTKTILWNWHLRLKHCRSKMINQLKKIDEIEIT